MIYMSVQLYFMDSINNYLSFGWSTRNFMTKPSLLQSPSYDTVCFKENNWLYTLQTVILCWKVCYLGIHWLTKIINMCLFIYFLLGLIMIQLFKFLPSNMKKFMFLDKTDISTFADQSFHFYSKFLLMSSYNHLSKKTNYFYVKHLSDPLSQLHTCKLSWFFRESPSFSPNLLVFQ